MRWPFDSNYWLILPLLALPAIGHGDTEQSTAAAAATVLNPITVLGTRTERPNKTLPRSIDSVGADQIATEQSSDLSEILEALPNISVVGSPRVGGEKIQIRGLSGDRILKLIDGVPEHSNSAHLSDVFVDPGLIKQVDAERGPASVMWGSGALGGVVSVRTKDAIDLLEPGQDIGARIRGGYQSASNGWAGSAAIYGTYHDRVDGLLYVDRSDQGDLELGNGERLDYSAYRRDTLLAKTTFYPTINQSIQLSHRSERLDGDAPANPAGLLSSRENWVVDREIATDTSQLEWRLTPDMSAVDLEAHIYHSRTKVDEYAPGNGNRDQTEIQTIGLDIANTSHIDLGKAGDHAITYGFDGYRDRPEATRNGGPRPEIPDGTRWIGGLFAQDEIGWGENWTTTLGLRYDRYHSETEDDVAPDQTTDHLSTQFGITWQATDWLSLYASYAEAFRAPSLTELYATGTHFAANHLIPNPNLKPEKAANKEIGFRTEWKNLFLADDHLSFDASFFRNDVEDYIETIVNVVPLPGPPYVGGTTRSENVHDARLQGFEANARYATEAWFVSLGYGQTRGDNQTEHQPLSDIAPDRWVFKLGYTALPWDGSIILRTTVAERQDRVPAGDEMTPGYTVYDLFTTWHPSENVRVDFGIANLTNKAYRPHNAVIAEAGRNVKASLTWKF